jgi:DNA-binding MarR family transcriptional regulator
MKPSTAAAQASTETWALFLTAHSVLVGAMEKRLKDAGLPPLAWYDVLWILERAPDQRLRMSALADQLVLTRFNVTRLVDRLVDAGPSRAGRRRRTAAASTAVLTRERPRLAQTNVDSISAGDCRTVQQHLSTAQDAEMQALMRRLLEQRAK